MFATVMCAAGDVRVVQVPDPPLVESRQLAMAYATFGQVTRSSCLSHIPMGTVTSDW
jgi:hypothetical protein